MEKQLQSKLIFTQLLYLFSFLGSEHHTYAHTLTLSLSLGVCCYKKRAIVSNVKAEIQSFQAQHPSFQPRLAIVQLGEKEDSNVYVSMKKKTCKQAGIEYMEHHLPESTSMAELLRTIGQLNADPSMHGILVQLPLPAHIDAKAVTESIDPIKDVDG